MKNKVKSVIKIIGIVYVVCLYLFGMMAFIPKISEKAVMKEIQKKLVHIFKSIEKNIVKIMK